MMLAMLMYCSGLGVELLCQNQREIFFLAGSRLDKNSLLRFRWGMKYGILLSKNLMASQVFWIINHCGITSGFCRPLKRPRNLELKFARQSISYVEYADIYKLRMFSFTVDLVTFLP